MADDVQNLKIIKEFLTEYKAHRTQHYNKRFHAREELMRRQAQKAKPRR